MSFLSFLTNFKPTLSLSSGTYQNSYHYTLPYYAWLPWSEHLEIFCLPSPFQFQPVAWLPWPRLPFAILRLTVVWLSWAQHLFGIIYDINIYIKLAHSLCLLYCIPLLRSFYSFKFRLLLLTNFKWSLSVPSEIHEITKNFGHKQQIFVTFMIHWVHSACLRSKNGCGW